MPNKRAKPSRTRIIGGKWRGRKLPIAAGVRPTPNRARETVFNWLAPTLPGARVLDVFAGTGALAFEALSRGARAATLLEINPATAQALIVRKQELAAAAEIICTDAVRWLRRRTEDHWELAFLDPPFASTLLANALPLVLAKLTPSGIAYVEAPPDQFQATLGEAGLTPMREAHAGAVRFGLVRKPGEPGMMPASRATADRRQ